MEPPPHLSIAVSNPTFSFTTPYETYELTPRRDYVRRPIDDGGNTPLHNAARAADLAKVRQLLLLATRSSLRIANDAGCKPLHYIAKHRGGGWSKVITTVLQKGGFTNSANIDGDTPLHIAARAKNASAVESLVNHACKYKALDNFLLRNNEEECPLYVAVAATMNPTMSDKILKMVSGSFLNKLFETVWLDYGPSEGHRQNQGSESNCRDAILLWLLTLQRSPFILPQDRLNEVWYMSTEGKLRELKQWMEGSSWLFYTLLWLVPREDFDVQYVYPGGQSILHIALAQEFEEIVKLLFKRRDLVEADREDEKGVTPLQYAVEKGLREIEIMLMKRVEVKESVERLYRDRQVYIDAANAILVGSALIASVTFVGWLQPPLGYGNAKENARMYATIQGHPGVSSFWVFNSLSFLFSMATMVAGAATLLPRPDLYIGTSVHVLKTSLSIAAFLLVLSVICGIGAFCSAGFAVLPPALMPNLSMILTVGIGGFVNLLMMGWFVKGLLRMRPGYVRQLRERALKNRLKARSRWTVPLLVPMQPLSPLSVQ